MRPAACLLLVGLLTLLLARRLGAQAGGGPGFSTPGYNQIQDSGTNLPKRRILDCEPAGACVDDPANDRTKITATGGGGGGTPGSPASSVQYNSAGTFAPRIPNDARQ